jgi:hypothetical protein
MDIEPVNSAKNNRQRHFLVKQKLFTSVIASNNSAVCLCVLCG